MDESLKNQVVDILSEEQNELDGCLDNPSDVRAPKLIERTSITQSSNGTWKKQVGQEESNLVDGSIDQSKRSGIIKKAETLQEFCKDVDNKILEFNSRINAKKQEIVNLSILATNGNCWPGIAHSEAPNTGITSSYSSSVTMNGEVERIKIYPKMAGPNKDYGAENVFEPDTIYIMTPEYAGYGYKNLPENVYYKNKDGTATGLGTDGSGTNIGSGRFDISTTTSDHNARLISALPYRYYDGAGVTPNASNTSVTGTICVSIANSITSIYNEIISLRKERDSLRSDLNTIKENKSEKELASWGMNRIENRVKARKTKNISAIEAVKKFAPNATISVDGLVLYLDVADSESYSGIGTSWNDLSGNGLNATLFPTNSPASYEYSDGGFLTFNGSDEYAQTVTKSSTIIGTGDWTIETWFRVNGPPSSITNVIVDTLPTSSTGNILHVTYDNFHEQVLTTGEVIPKNRFVYSTRAVPLGVYSSLIGPEITTGLWYHGVVVRNGANNTKIYLNGVLSNTYSSLYGNMAVGNSSSIVMSKFTDYNSFSNMSVSVVKVYTKAHTDAEIQQKFDASKGRYGFLG